jgi:hypothetical protein
MSVSTSGFTALLVVAMLALASCGDDAAPTTQADGSAAVETVTQTATATATAPQDEASKTTGEPAATGTTQTQQQTTTQSSPATTSNPAASTQRQSGACQSVEVGARDGDVEVTYARIDQAQKVNCRLAAEIAAQWGRQQMGIDKALLPLDWECTKGNVCSNGSRRVSFTLVKP